MSEAKFVRSIVDELNNFGYFIKTNGNNFSVKGTPDILGCINGQMVAIEVKVNGNLPTEKQLFELNKWANNYAIAFWVTDNMTPQQIASYTFSCVDYIQSRFYHDGVRVWHSATYWQDRLVWFSKPQVIVT